MPTRLYSAHDMARISSAECAGCGACCRGMGDTIVLDPYDIWQLTAGTGKPFQALLGNCLDLHVEEGVILPHLMMRKDTESCTFLGPDGRCTIHAFRPGICRLFPLGRQYDGPKTSYFIVEGGCVNGRLSKVTRLAAEPSEEVQRSINLYFLRTFYMTPYESAYEPPCEQTGGPSCEPTGGPAKAFYAELDRRISEFEKAVL